MRRVYVWEHLYTTSSSRGPTPLAFKLDIEKAAQRWEAFYAGEIIDRPVVCVTAPKEGFNPNIGISYYEKVHGDMDEIIERVIAGAEATFWGGEAIPTFVPSFGPDEIAVFTGAGLRWSDDSPNTNWSVPFVEDWEEVLPLRLQEDNLLMRNARCVLRIVCFVYNATRNTLFAFYRKSLITEKVV